MLFYHLSEIYARLIYSLISFVLVFCLVWDYKFKLLFNLTDFNLIFTNISSAFYNYLYFSLILSFIICLPVLYYHWHYFNMRGLYQHEITNKFIFFWLLFVSLIKGSMDLLGLFFTSFQSDYLKIALTIDNFLLFFIDVSFLLIFIFMFGYFNQFFISYFGRKMLYFFLILILACLTPPDIFSLIITLIPIIFISEVIFFFNINTNIG